MTRTLSPVPSVAEFERIVHLVIGTAEGLGELYRDALSAAYDPAGGSTDAKVFTDLSDPTGSAVLAGLTNGEDEPDRWSAERTALRSAIDALASTLVDMAFVYSRLRSVIRIHERRGMAGRSKTYTAAEAERIADQYDKRKGKVGR